MTPTVLFVCVENAARSLMAEALFNASAPPGWRAISAGTQPAARANPRTAAMLEELGVAMPAHAPRALAPEESKHADVRVTMGCLDHASCPAHLKDRPLLDWALPDPARLDDDGFRKVRDEIQAKVEALKVALRTDPGPAEGTA